MSASGLAWVLSNASSALQARSALTPSALAHGELWRLWTGHLVHFGGAHLRGDLLAFLVWAALLERESRAALGRVLLLGAPLLSLSVLLAYPGLTQYRGLSGLDCSLVVALIFRRGLANQRRRSLGVVCLACFAAKCGYELVTGHAILAPDLGAGVKLLPLAHLFGAAFGVVDSAMRVLTNLRTSARGKGFSGLKCKAPAVML